MIKLIKIILPFFLLGLLSCGEYESLEIDKSAKRSADSLYRVHRDSLIKSFEKQCQTNRDSLFKVYFDSLSLVEAEKIKRLIQK